MRPVTIVQAGQGDTLWLPIDYTPGWFGVGLGLSFSSDSNLTAKVQHTFSGPLFTPEASTRTVTFSQSTTTVTVTDTGPDGLGHRSITGDTVIMAGSLAKIDGTYDITVTSPTQYTFTSTVSQTAAGQAKVNTQRVFDHSTLTGLTARQDGYYAYNIFALRLKVTAGTTGSAYLDVLQGLGR